MKRTLAARKSIWVVLIALAIALSTSVAYADTGSYAGTYTGSYTKPYDVGVYEETIVLNGDGTGTNSVTYLGETATCAIRYMIDGSEIILTAVPTNVSVSGKIDGSGIWFNGRLLEKTGSTTSSPKATVKVNSSSSSKRSSSAASSKHYNENGYSVDLPASWSGRVTVNEPDAHGTTFEVRSKQYPDRVLCKIEVVASRDRVKGGDIGNPVVKQVTLSDGRVACVRATNYSWIVASSSAKMSTAEAAELVSLSTGGKTVADCERAFKNGDNKVSANWIANNVKVTAK